MGLMNALKDILFGSDHSKLDAHANESEKYKEKHHKVVSFYATLHILLSKYDFDRLIVDTNVFLNIAEGVDSKGSKFFTAIQELKIKIFIVIAQLNELSNMKRANDEKSYKVRLALKKIEDLQDKGLLEILGDTSAQENYADPEIRRMAIKLSENGLRPLVITEDRDLRIRLGADRIQRISLDELFKERFTWGYGVLRCEHEFLCVNKESDVSLSAAVDGKCDGLFSIYTDHSEPKIIILMERKKGGGLVCVDEMQNNKLRAIGGCHENEDHRFELIYLGGERPSFALKSKANGKFVSVCEDQGRVLSANVADIRDCARFEVQGWEFMDLRTGRKFHRDLMSSSTISSPT